MVMGGISFIDGVIYDSKKRRYQEGKEISKVGIGD
jgi:hypothetical protein